jgi:hypothetical protein
MKTRNQITQVYKVIRTFPMTLELGFSNVLHRLLLVLSVVITFPVLADPATVQAQSACSPVPDMLYGLASNDLTSEIWIVNPDTKQELCHAQTNINEIVDQISDIAFHQNNATPFDQNSLYGVTDGFRFIMINPNNWRVSEIRQQATPEGTLHALAFREDDSAYSSINIRAATRGSWLIKINKTTGEWSYLTTPKIAVYPDVYQTDDLAFREDGVLFASVRRDSDADGTSWLAFVNRNTGGATLIGDIGYQNVTGLSFRHGVLYGVTADGILLKIDPTSGKGEFIKQFSANFRGLATHIKPGDANGDGKVDGIDYVTWLNNYDRQTSSGRSEGDFNGDGKVDGVDYVIWLNNYDK